MEAVAILAFLTCFILLALGVVGLFKPLTRLKMPNRLAALGWIIGGFVGMGVAAVNAPPSAKSDSRHAPVVAEAPAKAESPLPQPAPPPPSPMYSSIDGDDYLYSAGISDEAKNAGQVAGQFMAFRYRGMKDGKIILSSEGMTLRCDENCTVITMIDQFGRKQHIEYNEESVAGAAFKDAMNGLLEEHPSRKLKAMR